MRNLFKQAFVSLIDLIFPRFCPVCHRPLALADDAMCISCMNNLPLIGIEDSRDNILTRTLWPGVPIEHGLSLMHYRSQTPHHNLLMQFKYMKNPMLARKLGKLAATILAQHKLEADIDVVIPVPLSWQRKLKRGYNQAEWLAKGMAEVYHLPVNTTLLRRVKHRKPQTKLNQEERRENAKGQFRARIPEQMKGKRILLVDDVCTTGATLGACAQAILESDPTARVSIFALAWA